MKTQQQQQSRITVDNLIDIIQGFRDYNSRMESQQMLTFLLVCKHEKLGITNIGERLGITGSSASRNVTELSTETVRGKKGLGLVKVTVDAMDRRYKYVSLTPKGEAFYKELLKI